MDRIGEINTERRRDALLPIKVRKLTERIFAVIGMIKPEIKQPEPYVPTGQEDALTGWPVLKVGDRYIAVPTGSMFPNRQPNQTEDTELPDHKGGRVRFSPKYMRHPVVYILRTKSGD